MIAAATSSGVDEPVLSTGEVGDPEALLLEALARVEHGLVLGLDRDDVVALVREVRLRPCWRSLRGRRSRSAGGITEASFVFATASKKSFSARVMPYIRATPLRARLSDSVAPEREDDLGGRRADQRRDLLARHVDGLLRVSSRTGGSAGGVAVLVLQVRHHRLEDARIHRRRRVDVHVDGGLQVITCPRRLDRSR